MKELNGEQYAENRKILGIGIKAGLIPMLLFFAYSIITSLENMDSDLIGGAILLPILILWPAVILGVLGAAIGRYWKKTHRATWIGALLGALPLSAIIIYGFLNFCIGWC